MACDQDPATPGALPCDSERPLHGRLVLHGLLPTSSAPSTKEHSCVPGPEGWLSRSIESKGYSPRDSPANYGASYRRIPATPNGISYPHPVLRCRGTAGRSPSETVQRSSSKEQISRYLQAFDRGSQSRAQEPLSPATFHVKHRQGCTDRTLQRTIKQGLQYVEGKLQAWSYTSSSKLW